jgi:hypothetical protein
MGTRLTMYENKEIHRFLANPLGYKEVKWIAPKLSTKYLEGWLSTYEKPNKKSHWQSGFPYQTNSEP